jgi:hypothetical protein
MAKHGPDDKGQRKEHIEGDISRPQETTDAKASSRRPQPRRKTEKNCQPKNADLDKIEEVQFIE